MKTLFQSLGYRLVSALDVGESAMHFNCLIASLSRKSMRFGLSDKDVAHVVDAVKTESREIADKNKQPYDEIYRCLITHVQRSVEEQKDQEFKDSFYKYILIIAPEFLPQPKSAKTLFNAKHKLG